MKFTCPSIYLSSAIKTTDVFLSFIIQVIHVTHKFVIFRGRHVADEKFRGIFWRLL